METPRPVRKRRPHPARRSRRVVGAGSVAAMVTLTGCLAVAGVPASTASTPVTAASSDSSATTTATATATDAAATSATAGSVSSQANTVSSGS